MLFFNSILYRKTMIISIIVLKVYLFTFAILNSYNKLAIDISGKKQAIRT